MNESFDELYSFDIAKHVIEIEETGKVKHSLYTIENEEAVNIYNYCADKYCTRSFLNFIEPITTDWEKDYSIDMCDGYQWSCTLKYVDGTNKIIKGTVSPPPFSDDIETRIKNLVKYDVAPRLF